MSRIKDWKLEDLNAEQLEIYNEIVNGPRGSVVGPIRVWLNNPKFAKNAQKVGQYIRYESSLPSRLSELAIITTGRCWSSEFEWEQHAPLAEKAGIHIDYINNIANAKRPLFKKLDEQIVFDFAVECNLLKNVLDQTYEEAINILGYNSVIDLVGTCGYYNLISMTLNAFQISKEGNNWVLPKIDDLNGMLKSNE